MSFAYTITVDSREVEAAFKRLGAALTPAQMAAAAGPAVHRTVFDHIAKLGPNRRGWPTTRFYGRAARATTWQAVADGLVVTVAQIGFRQRYYGGVIRPTRRRMLAIPISPVSYGKVPADFPGLFLLPTRKGVYLVQHGEGVSATGNIVRGKFGRDANERRRRRAALNFLFKLKAFVVQAGDKTILPNDADLLGVALTAIGDSAVAAWRST